MAFFNALNIQIQSELNSVNTVSCQKNHLYTLSLNYTYPEKSLSLVGC